MQTIRANLTKLKTLVSKELPDGQDIFGYAGISKEMIISFMDEAYNLSYTLVDLEPKFEITILKRKISTLIEECKKYINDDVKGWNKEKRFDGFVNNLTSIREQIRLTYLVVIDKGLRTEEVSNKILEDCRILADAHEQYQEEVSHLREISMAMTTAQEDSEAASAKIRSNLDLSENASKSISTHQNESESSLTLITKFEDEIRQKREYIANISEKLGSLEMKSKVTLDEIDASKLEIEAIGKSLSGQVEINKDHQREIQDTIESANRKGMAGSFKSRKDELDAPIRIWGGIFIVAIVAIFLIGYHFLSPYLSSTATVDKVDMLLKIALVSPFVWLAWMSVKQYGYLSRIQEDYAYKYASAMAFEGYKKQAKDIDEDLLRQLLAVSVENLSQNPIRLFSSKDNHASPANEIVKDFMATIRGNKE